jgi:hypothetical protein
VFFRRLTRCEGPKIPPLSGFWVLLSRVQAVLARFKFPDHILALLWYFNRRSKAHSSPVKYLDELALPLPDKKMGRPACRAGHLEVRSLEWSASVLGAATHFMEMRFEP